MHIELFDNTERALLAIGFGVSILAAGVLQLTPLRRHTGWGIAGAFVFAALLGFEKLAAAVAARAAPADVDFNEYRWVLLSPWGRVALIAGCVAGVATIVLTALSTRHARTTWRWSAIVGLRTAAVATALVLFLQPAIELRQVAREPNRIAILVDDSLSMELADERSGPSRRQRARELLESSWDTFEHWRKDHLIDVYQFSERSTPSSLESAASLPAKGKASLLRQALEETRGRYRGDELAGIVVVSDGIVTGDLSNMGEGEVRDFVHALETPIHSVWAGRPGLRDIAVAEVHADEFAFVRTVTKVEAVIRSTGYDERRIPVTLSSDGKAMRRKWVTVGPGNTESRVTFEFTPPRVGKYVYNISTTVDDDEAVAENNSSWFVIRVIRDKIRVLQVAGQPTWDVRALRGMLKQNPNVDLISFFILRTQDDISQAPNNELSLIPFPTRDLFLNELPSFDLVVLQNFDYLPYGIGQYLENIRAYVEGGGGMMMLGGPLSFGSGRYDATPIAEALPVELPSHLAPPSELFDLEGFQPELTELGRIHPVTALRYEESDNLAVWKNLPALEGVNKVVRAKKNASVLAVHPTLRAKGQPMPVVIAGDYGEGRSLAVTTDSLWRWGFVAASSADKDGRHYLKFWDNAIRWLIQDPDLRYLHVESDRVSYEPAATAQISVRLLAHDYTPTKDGHVALTIHRGDDPNDVERIAETKLVTSDRGMATFELPNLQPGVYRAKATATVEGREVAAEDIFLVRNATAEHANPAADDRSLKLIAELSKGSFSSTDSALSKDLAFTEPQVVRVDRRSDVDLWSLPWLLLCALLFLGLEWVLRQRSGNL